jgi:hypothetical protein
MEVGPPGVGYRISPQTTQQRVWIGSQAVNGLGKGEFDSSGAGRKANGSELRIFCRKTLNRHRNRADLAALDKSSESLSIGWTVTGR